MIRSVRNVIAILAIGLSVIAGAQAPSVTERVRANAVRLTTVEAGHGFNDQQPLKRIIGTARIVTLGEATHGSREFFQLKHRLLEFLATEMGFTSDWTPYVLELPVDATAKNVNFGVLMPADGTAWFDDLRIVKISIVSFFRLNTPFFQQVASTSTAMMRRSPVTTA